MNYKILFPELDWPDSRPYLVAELSGNHNQDIGLARELVEAAADAGADAVKVQTLQPEWITLKSCRDEFKITNKSSPWCGKRLFDLYSAISMPLDWHFELQDLAKKRKLQFFSSPFSPEAVDFLEVLDVPMYKIASFEIVDIPLIEKVAATMRPVVVSTGMATEAEISDAVSVVRKYQSRGPIVLKCTSEYPARTEDLNLKTLAFFRDELGVFMGLSDHSMSNIPSVLATGMGALLIEKHLTMSRAAGGLDAGFSLEPDEFRSLVLEVSEASACMGSVRFGGTTDAEKNARGRRRSLYVVQDVKVGDVVTDENIRSVRPGLGMPPKNYEAVLGRKFVRSVSSGTPLATDMLSES